MDSPVQVTVRDSREEDIAAIAAIYAHAVLHGTASFELKPPDASEMAARRARVLGQGLPHLVGELDGRVAGYAYAGLYHSRPAYRWTVESSIYVDHTLHRRGVARTLLVRLLAECEQRGFRQMLAIIGDSANAASIGLHAALGFTQAGVFRNVGFKHGRWLDSVIMQRALGPGASRPPDGA